MVGNQVNICKETGYETEGFIVRQAVHLYL